MKNSFWISLFISISYLSQAQVLNGIVKDGSTLSPLQYVHIGIEGKNVGVISNDLGEFSIDLSDANFDDEVKFSIIGYETINIPILKLESKKLEILMNVVEYQIQPIEIKGRKSKKYKLGRFKTSKTTTGQSGIDDFGFGGEWGVKIIHPGRDYYLKDLQFHTRFNTVDSVLYRINIYDISNNLPGDSKLHNQIFTTSYKRDKWVKADLISQNLLIQEDIIVTFELVRIWYGDKGGNNLFYTHGKDYPQGLSYSRESSQDKWSVDKRAPLAMFVTALFD